MATTPATFGMLDDLLDQEIQILKPTYTYRYDEVLDQFIGMTDGKDASYQAIKKIMRTNKYQNEIYDWRYGHELESLVGKNKAYAKVEIERLVREAVMQDDRVTGVRDYTVIEEGVDFITVSVTIDTITMPFIFDLEVPW